MSEDKKASFRLLSHAAGYEGWSLEEGELRHVSGERMLIEVGISPVSALVILACHVHTVAKRELLEELELFP